MAKKATSTKKPEEKSSAMVASEKLVAELVANDSRLKAALGRGSISNGENNDAGKNAAQMYRQRLRE